MKDIWNQTGVKPLVAMLFILAIAGTVWTVKGEIDGPFTLAIVGSFALIYFLLLWFGRKSSK